MLWDGVHPPSGNTFLFFLDPDGLSLEYGCGMELFPEQNARAPRIYPAKPESFDTSGSTSDGRMAAAGEIEQALAKALHQEDRDSAVNQTQSTREIR